MGNRVLLRQFNHLSEHCAAELDLGTSKGCLRLGNMECAAKAALFFQEISIEKNVPIIMALDRCCRSGSA